GDTEQLPLKGAQMAVKIDGFRARVLVDYFFFSNESVQMEGTFKMKLPQGASPYYFAFGESVYLDKKNTNDSLPFIASNQHVFSTESIKNLRSDAWLAPKEAQVVPKEKAAFAYGQTVRRQIDPALAEWAGADIYNCRVFPLIPEKLHRIVIGYDVNLTPLNSDWLFNLAIPKVDCPLILDFDIADIDGVKSEILPKTKISAKNGRKQFRLENPTDKEISIRYKSLKNMAITSSYDKENYFAYSVTSELPQTNISETSTDAVIALDISLSSNPDKFNVWLQLTEALLNNNRNRIERFNVLMFNIEAFWWKQEAIKNTPENVKAFLAYANKLALEGASDINLALSTIATEANSKNKAENIFLLSDGDDTWGEDDSYAMVNNIKPNDRLFAFNTGMSGTSINKLNHLTRASGGALFTVTGEDEVQKTSTAFASKPWKIEKIDGGQNKDILIAGRPDYIYPNQQLFISGRGLFSKNSKLKLQISQNGVKKTITLSPNYVIKSDLARRTYGQMATSILEEFNGATEKESIAYARHFSVPGKTCSLLMLETEEDYKQYEIDNSDNSTVVMSSTVNQLLSEILLVIENLLANPKKKFENWLQKLTKTDGMSLELSTSLLNVIEQTPTDKFIVNQRQISSKSIMSSDIPKAFLGETLNASLDYDKINEEAQRRLKKYSKADGLKTLSSLIEKNQGDAVITRDIAYTALNWGMSEQAYYLFKRVLNSRPYEPQTYLAIAKSLAKSGNIELSILYYEIAITAEWNPRFGEFRRIATLDYLNFLQQTANQKETELINYTQNRYTELKAEFDENSVDIMVVISWNTDNTDIDLHVIEPTGEECFYNHPKTKIGGYITEDVTTGYGPEMYMLPNAKKGNYQVKVKYFSSNRNRASTRTKVYVSLYKNWGTKKQTVTNKIITLADNKEMHDIMTIDLE
ncbi:MAG: hypothetical protein ACI81T_004509, partial [Bacteroidia bacterium]